MSSLTNQIDTSTSNHQDQPNNFFNPHDEIVIKTAKSQGNRYLDVQPSDLEDLQQYLQELKSEVRKRKFLGLSNQGATCYMNSLLQALFMTPEFREFIYKWPYIEDLHGEKDYSIPFQLQRLFAQLQISKKRAADTRGLTKSFGWNGSESFQQHDTQEFCRVLFDAIEQSFAIAGQECSKIRDLYQGTSVSYVKCEECGYESQNQDKYLDLSLPIRNDQGPPTAKDNPFHMNNVSLDMALENYLKPEKLEGDNQYACSNCNKKVNATKGIKLQSSPQILTVQLNRFTLDWTTYQMVKVHDRVTFPYVLNMNDYLNGYEGITNKVSEKLLLEKMNQQEQQNIEAQIGNTFNYEAKSSVAFDIDFKSKQEKQNLANSSHSDNLQNSGLTTAASNIDDAQMTDLSSFKSSPDRVGSAGSDRQKIQEIPKFDGEDELMADHSRNQAQDAQTLKQHSSQDISPKDSQKSSQDEIYKVRAEKQRKEEENQHLIEQYKKQGDQVYELFAVLVHAGTQGAGHYYAYIKDYEINSDGCYDWVLFNDQEVKLSSQEEVERVYGQKYGDPTAYLLMYRRVIQKDAIPQITNGLIPDHFNKEVQQQTEAVIREQEEIFQQMIQLNLKVYDEINSSNSEGQEGNYNIQEFKFIKTQTLEEIVKILLEGFGYDLNTLNYKNNVRIRAFDEKRNTKLSVYDQYDQNLLKLRFNSQTVLLIEHKNDNQEFEEYNPDWIFLRVMKYEENTDYQQLQPEIISKYAQVIRMNKKLDSIYDLESKVGELYKLPLQKIVMLLRLQFGKSSSVRSEVINLNWRKSKTLEEGPRLDNDAVIFVETGDTKDKNENFKWHQEFNKEYGKIVLLINDPTKMIEKSIEYSVEILARKNDTLSDLKIKIGEQLGLNPTELIVRRPNNNIELKNLQWKLQDYNMADQDKLKIEMGKPQVEGTTSIDIYEIKFLESDNSDEVIFEKKLLFNQKINPNLQSIELKRQVLSEYNLQNNTNLSENSFKLRIGKDDELGDVMRDSEIIDNYDLYEGKQLYLEIIDQNQSFDFVNFKDPNNCYHILVREWDPETWKFGRVFDIKVDKQAYSNKLAIFLSEKVFPHIPAENIQGCKLNFLKGFKRSELVLKRWNVLKTQATKIALSAIKINKDSDLIIIKDSRRTVREELTEEEMKKWSTPSFVTYLSKRVSKPKPSTTITNKIGGVGAKSGTTSKTGTDAKIDIKRKMIEARKNKAPEKGIKIQVGAPQQFQQQQQQDQQKQEDLDQILAVQLQNQDQEMEDNSCVVGSGVLMQF
eukprot:403332628